jgi:hypothetical protein
MITKNIMLWFWWYLMSIISLLACAFLLRFIPMLWTICKIWPTFLNLLKLQMNITQKSPVWMLIHINTLVKKLRNSYDPILIYGSSRTDGRKAPFQYLLPILTWNCLRGIIMYEYYQYVHKQFKPSFDCFGTMTLYTISLSVTLKINSMFSFSERLFVECNTG